MTPSPELGHHIVLVGGGHSHVGVLEDWIRAPAHGVRLTVVTDGPRAAYSGMVPGFVAGQYRLDEIEIDVRELSRKAGAEWIEASVTGLDSHSRTLHIRGAPSLAYDTVSFDVGSTVSGLDLPGVREHGLPIRPIGAFARRVDALLERLRGNPAARIVIVGGGPGGVELAFAFRARFKALGLHASSVLLLESGKRILPGYPQSAALRIERNAQARGVVIRCGTAVATANAVGLTLATGETLACDAFIWVAESASLPLFAHAGLDLDSDGFVKVRTTLQAIGHDEIFASGDCASLVSHPRLPKAGVYAVREAPVLAHNLRAIADARALQEFRPQRRILALLNLGDGHALAVRGALSAEGAWAWWLKNRIDRAFVRRYG